MNIQCGEFGCGAIAHKEFVLKKKKKKSGQIVKIRQPELTLTIEEWNL